MVSTEPLTDKDKKNSQYPILIQNLSHSIQICVITLIFKRIKNQ
jgi:hypothetical protein